MGDYTPTQKFYLIDGTELVNVDQDLNYNFARADTRVKPLVEYQFTDEPSITNSTLTKETGFKWYKTYNNSVWAYRNGVTFEDVNSRISEWAFEGILFQSGYGSANLEEGRIAWSINDGFGILRGRLVLNGGGTDLPLNTTTKFMTLPDAALPVKARYFTVYGGNAGSDFQMARIYIPARTSTDKNLEFCKYGGASTVNSEKYISLNDCYYALGDT